MSGLPLYRTAILPDWIDYNGHLRDAYYGLVLSLACDALMDRVGLDAAYRSTTHCTLYTLEQHIAFRHEVKLTDTLEVSMRLIALDAKRVHAGFEMHVAGHRDPVATAEMLLLHVCQRPVPTATPFAPPVAAALEALRVASAAHAPAGAGSRRIELRSR